MTKVWAIQQDNNTHGKSAKLELRELILQHVQPARVFDAYCGEEGVMYQKVWSKAETYIGCDVKWDPADPRPRYFGDSLRVMRCIDLHPFNVFDVDCYGDPWPVMHLLMHRRVWAKGELGAVVMTDGSAARTRFGRSSKAIMAMTGLPMKFAPTVESSAMIMKLALSTWIQKQGFEVVKRWTAAAKNSKQWESVRYTAIVFRGAGVEVRDEGPNTRQ